MTRQSDFKRLVRERMTKTGQSYAAAKASLIGQRERIYARTRSLAGTDPRRRAEAQLSRAHEHLRDAVDGALAAGLDWGAIGAALGLDPEFAEMWIRHE